MCAITDACHCIFIIKCVSISQILKGSFCKNLKFQFRNLNSPNDDDQSIVWSLNFNQTQFMNQSSLNRFDSELCVKDNNWILICHAKKWMTVRMMEMVIQSYNLDMFYILSFNDWVTRGRFQL